MKNYILLFAITRTMLLFGCITTKNQLREANTLIEFKKSDFTISDQLTGDAKQIKVIGIDWARIFKKEKGALFINIIGKDVQMNKVKRYALYNLFKQNPGYDVVFYPVFDYRRVNVLGVYIKTEVKATAKLGKLNKTE